MLGMTANELVQMKTEGNMHDMSSLNKKLKTNLYHAIIMKSAGQPFNRGEQQPRMSISTITLLDSTADALEAGGSSSMQSEINTAKTTVNQILSDNSKISKVSVEQILHPVNTTLSEKADINELKITARRSLELNLAEEENQLKKKMKASFVQETLQSTAIIEENNEVAETTSIKNIDIIEILNSQSQEMRSESQVTADSTPQDKTETQDIDVTTTSVSI